jgi:RHS repeat-associated protein
LRALSAFLSGQPPGWYRFVNYAHSTTSGVWTGRTQDAYVDIPTVSLEINRSGTGTGSIAATGLSCPGGSNTQAMPCGASYALGSVVWLTAVADPGSTFAGWGGGCLGTQPTCGVTLAGDRYTFAYFTKTPDTVATTYYHTDAIGSVRALSDDTGATVMRHDYLPFGEDTQPLTGDPMRFAGKELDPESALMNFEARYYRNTWGRFTQVDPVHVEAALLDPQQWNRYAYARNNPLAYGDPSGEFALHLYYFFPIAGPWGPLLDLIGAAGGAFGGDLFHAIFGGGGGGSAQPPHHRDSDDNPVVGIAHGRNDSPQDPGSIDNPGPMTPTPTPDPGPPTPNPGPPTPTCQDTGTCGGGDGGGFAAGNKCAPGDLWCLLATDIANRTAPISDWKTYVGFYGLSAGGGAAGAFVSSNLFRQFLFARGGQGLLNGRLTGDWIRLGYSWLGDSETGVPTFRFAVGNAKRLGFKWEKILWIRDFPYSVTRPTILPRTY